MMTPNYSTESEQTFHRSECPTSPWTETFRASVARANQQAEQEPTSQRSFDHETQAPTHDALSAIYNPD